MLVERPSEWRGMDEDGVTFSIKGKCKRADSSEFFKRFTVSVQNSDKICHFNISNVWGGSSIYLKGFDRIISENWSI